MLTANHPIPSTENTNVPLVHIGIVSAADLRNGETLEIYRQTGHLIEKTLSEQFPQFRWCVSFQPRYRYTPRGALNPLPLLEMGVQEKLYHRWDYALVFVPNELTPRDRVRTIGIPSSALETAVLSSAPLRPYDNTVDRLAALCLHLLGHLWDLTHESGGLMTPPENPGRLELQPFTIEQREGVGRRLKAVADKRLEEQKRQWNSFTFYLHTFRAEFSGIMHDIWYLKPWRLPFQMGRLTAATFISLIVLLIAAEAWEVGTNTPVSWLGIGMIVATLIATSFIFYGQNLGKVSREIGWREQLVRTRIVTFMTLLAGMFFLWLVLLMASLLVAVLMPPDVLAGWIGRPITAVLLLRQAAFMAVLGVLAGALGGNLEDEDDLKAKIFYDEET